MFISVKLAACGTSNFVPYVPRLFLIWSRTSHNELFCGVKKKNSTPNELHLKLGMIVEKLVIENEYDARTYGPIRSQE